MNLYGYAALGLALIAAVAWGAVERGNANSWHGKYDSLKASYAQAASDAKADAQRQEQADLANLKQQSSQAIQQAQAAKHKAQNELTAYQKKLAAAATEKDLGHRCAGIEIPKDLLP